MLFKVHHLHLKTRDPQKTAKWWVENLGAKIEEEAAHGTHFKLDLDGIPLFVSEFVRGWQTRQQRYGLEHMGIRTDDYKNVLKKLKANGARVLEEQKDGQGVFLETPDGVQIELHPIGFSVTARGTGLPADC